MKYAYFVNTLTLPNDRGVKQPFLGKICIGKLFIFRRKEGGDGQSPPPPIFRTFVKDFTKRVLFFSIFGPAPF